MSELQRKLSYVKFIARIKKKRRLKRKKSFYCSSVWRNKKSSEGDAIPVTSDFQFVVILSRLFGCHPHSVSLKKFARTTRLSKIYSSLWFVGAAAIAVFEIRQLVINSKSNDESDSSIKSLSAYNVTVSTAHCFSSIFSIIRANHFDDALQAIHRFEAATEPRRKIKFLENLLAAVFIVASSALAIWICGPMNDLVTKSDHTLQLIVMSLFSVEIFKFSLMFKTLLRSFKKLNKIVSTGKITIFSGEGVYWQPLTVQHVFILRRWLVDSAESLNRYYDAQIVYWFCQLILSLIVQAAIIVEETTLYGLNPRDFGLFVLTFYWLVSLCALPHFACKRANELGTLLFGYGGPSLKTTVSSLEITEFGFYLVKKPLQITGAKLFTVHLPLLLSIMEAFATYTTFVLQLVNLTNNRLNED